jgi:serine/threonine protein kinase
MDIPGFKLGREISDGEYFRGYNALDLGNHKTVNIQAFDSSLIANEAFSSQFRDVTSKLVGANFGIMVPILQADISTHICYVVSRYFPTPQQLPATPQPLTRYQIFQFALELAQTLDHLHKAGLVHGGIEYSALYFKGPHQLVLRPVMLQRVIPILQPKAVKSQERTQKRYLAPEAHEGLTPATDFYALGVLLYELIFGPVPVNTTEDLPPEEWSFAGKNQGFEALIRQLLKADPGQRIQSLDQFTEALQQCGIDLLEFVPDVSKTTLVQEQKANDGEVASRSPAKWIVLTASLAVIALAGTLTLLPDLDEAEQQPELEDKSKVVASTDTTNVEIEPVAPLPAPTLAKNEPAETSPSIEDLYQQALIQKETNPETALLTVKNALEQKPGDVASLELKQQIEKELEVRSLISTAEQQLKEQKLLQPSGDNAYESYLTLAKKLSPDDERVRSGFTHIAAAFFTMAENLLKAEHLDKAQEHVDLGLSVMDNYPPLLQLRDTINVKKEDLQRKLKLAQLEKQRELEKQSALKKQRQLKEMQAAKALKQRQLREKQAAEALKQRQLKEMQAAKARKQRQLREKQAAEALKQRQLQEKQAARARKQRQLQEKQAAEELKLRQQEQANKVAQAAMEQDMESAKEAKVDALLISANKYLNHRRLTLKNVLAAHLLYDELQKLDATGQRDAKLKKALIDAYKLLAVRQPSDKLYKLAIQAIEQRVQMQPQDLKQLQIKSRLSFSSF